MDGTAALAVLGLSPGASASQIKAAFRARAKLVHPDHRGAAESFVALRQAYETATAEVGARQLDGPVVELLDRPRPVLVPDAAPLPRRRPPRWLADDVRPAPVIDVCDIIRRAADRRTDGRPTTRSFAEHLAVALAS